MLDSNPLLIPDGHVTSPMGFMAAATIAGLKKSGKPDIAMIVSDFPAVAAATFTSCKFAAAPVQYDIEILKRKKPVQAVIINSGNANACTGETGLTNTKITAAQTAQAIGCDQNEVLVSSTGRIGVQLPMAKILPAIQILSSQLSHKNGMAAAEAIMTTDTQSKHAAVSFILPSSGTKITLGGICKGAGMIAPGMVSPDGLHATMLCYLTTDLQIEQDLLQELLQISVDLSFNRISVDGDMSTNDTALFLANGASQATLQTEEDLKLFQKALIMLTQYLAKAIVMDGEGVSKFVTLFVRHAHSAEDAKKASRAVANSLLCKTAWFGGDPNWGRVLAAIGYSGANFDPNKVSMHYDTLPVVLQGMDAGTPESELAKVLKKREFSITIDLMDGEEEHWIWTNDISYEYVKINAEYFT